MGTVIITGATGFIGRNLLELLLRRGDQVHALVRAGSIERLHTIGRRFGADPDQLVAVTGDLGASRLGVGDADLARLAGADHLFHLAAVYDLAADAAATRTANVDGTRHALELAAAVEVGCFHHLSSIAAAGRYPGTFTEEMLDEAVDLDHPYFATKHESERLVRETATVPWRVYRPGVVVGRSDTGEIDKVDGPYYFLPYLARVAAVPGASLLRVPIAFPGLLNVVPVDYVARAVDHIAHTEGLDGKVFNLVDPSPRRVGQVLDVFSRAIGGPRFVQLPAPPAGPARSLAAGGGPLRPPIAIALSRLGLPGALADELGWETRFDTTNTDAALAGSGISLPPLEQYVEALWSYWRRRLDPAAKGRGTLGRAVDGRTVMITGASSGIGRATALEVAAAGGIPLLVARGVEALEATKREIEEAGGTAFIHPADLSDVEDCQRLAKDVLETHGYVDVLVNNAGRSIRRSVASSGERFHDFERTMQLNYFGAVALIVALLPSMRARKRGHIVNISTIGVQTYPPRFSAYVASKAALDAFSRTVASEVYADGVRFTAVHMPLVRTPMIAPTTIYKRFPALTPDQAAAMVCRAIADRPKRVSTPIGLIAQVTAAVAPEIQDRILNLAYQLIPESSAAKGDKAPEPVPAVEPSSDQTNELSPAARVFVQLLRGIHW